MATVHLSEIEAARDISSLMAQVRQGDEVYIESADGFTACLQPSDPSPLGMDVDYDKWVTGKVQEALDDPRPAVSDAEMSLRMVQHRTLRALERSESAR